MLLDSEEFNALILEEPDPKTRALLLYMQQMHRALVQSIQANTEQHATFTHTMDVVATRFEQHIVNYEQRTAAEDARVNQGRGMWRILGTVLSILQVLILSALGVAYKEIDTLHTHIAQDQVLDTETIRRICKEDRK
jgi:hypothetical protein